MATEARAGEIDVRLPTILRPHAEGQSSVRGDGATLRELLEGIVQRYPALRGQLITDDGALHRFVNVYRNDDDVRYIGGLDAPVQPGDVVSLIPAVAGG